MIKTLLIANRGEIACRIIRTAREMGIKTVAVYSEADTNAPHVRMADDAIYIGESPSTQSYLNQKNIINAIKISGADAVHPGYGFLSENEKFARKLEKLGIIFVGPSKESIKVMGDKIEAKKAAQKAGVNIVPGYMGVIKSAKDAAKIASKIGYPVMIKAAAGGGGKGMRVVRSNEEMVASYEMATSEAQNNFSDGRIFIEKFIENPRHIEIQVLGDQNGNYVCLGERECSVQRRHQKIIEECPSPFVDEKMRKKMYAQSIALAKRVKYYSAGTVEFIVDNKKNFYFLEMNTRLQVEHPVTELVTGYDLVEQMIKIASGEKLKIKQKDVELKGWAIESRIYAEDPTCGFLPSTGLIEHYKEPSKSDHVRVDSGIYEGGEVSMFYDAMIAKLCTYANSRAKAIKHMQRALGEYTIRGVSNNISFLQDIYSSDAFQQGDITTNFIDKHYKDGFTGSELTDESGAVLLCTAVYLYLTNMTRNLQISGKLRGRSMYTLGTRWVVNMDGVRHPVTARKTEDGYKVSFQNRKFYINSKWVLGSKLFSCKINDKEYHVQTEQMKSGYRLEYMGISVDAKVMSPRAAELSKYMRSTDEDENTSDLVANIAGMVIDVKVEADQEVIKGQSLVVLEAMKMQNILSAEVDGIVKAVNCKPGDNVLSGDVLIEIEESKEEDKKES
jgi:propionyl-CoA carboxylase alpha chain